LSDKDVRANSDSCGCLSETGISSSRSKKVFWGLLGGENGDAEINEKRSDEQSEKRSEKQSNEQSEKQANLKKGFWLEG